MGALQTPGPDRTLTAVGSKSHPRRLKLNPSWVNPTDSWRVGQKRLVDLYPRGLREQMADERKKAVDAIVRGIEAQLLAAPDKDKDKDKESEEDLKLQLSQLRVLQKELGSGPGPMLECIVWHDGERYQAAVHDRPDFASADVQPMTNYRDFYQCRTFSHFDALTYAVNIFDSGTVLSIVVDAGSHGTHVAGIVGAYHGSGGSGSSSGVAPGCQIVSLKIGDTRLGSMETGVGLVRALLDARRRGCDIINMSYGEGTAWDNAGFFKVSAVLWSGVEWSGVEWSGVEWSGVEWGGVGCWSVGVLGYLDAGGVKLPSLARSLAR